MGAHSSNGTVNLTGSTFMSNTASAGGGAYFATAVSVAAAIFMSNTASGQGGGVYLLGNAAGTEQFVNVLFAANHGGTAGAAVYANHSGGDDTLTLLYATVASPTVVSGSAIYIANGTVSITNTIITSHTIGIQQAGGTTTQNYNLFFGNTSNIVGTVGGGTGQVNANPLFVNPAAHNYHLACGQPGH